MEQGKYINDERVTDEFIEDILNKCGFELIRFQPDPKTGRSVEVDPIIRLHHQIMVHCRNVSMLEFIQDLSKMHPLFGMMQNVRGYSVGDEVIFLEDFMANRLTVSDEIQPQDEKLFDEFYRAMSSMFGMEYEKDFKKYCAEYLQNINAQNSSSENSLPDNVVYIKEVEK